MHELFSVDLAREFGFISYQSFDCPPAAQLDWFNFTGSAVIVLRSVIEPKER